MFFNKLEAASRAGFGIGKLIPHGFASQNALTLSFRLAFGSDIGELGRRITEDHSVLRRKRVKRRIAKDPEAENDPEEDPDISRMKRVCAEWLSAHDSIGIEQERE